MKLFLKLVFLIFISLNLFSDELELQSQDKKAGDVLSSSEWNSVMKKLRSSSRKVKDEMFVIIKMTLTTPNCPVAESLPNEVKNGAMQVEGIEDVDLELVWDPPWNKDMMSEAAKLELNL